MKLTSKAFKDGEPIPEKYTCEGDDSFPPLEISDVPENTESFALIVDDPDAPMGTWDHLVCWNIPKETRIIESPKGILGKNSWGRTDWGGPCPPSGTHRYYFKLYALDSALNLPEGSEKSELLEAMKGHIIEKAELVGKYKRKHAQE
ncbi:YbhB/YbcL family Raf kinase inhibitor-like protein [Candidatus Woesearchaeota archaeon]|nr:MAG: YbhB/YbcL family Raf kinase inhibitor-like protein [Candidatus Woesearchaeota archaeon]